GALNWTSTPNYVVIAGSTRTLPGPAPAPTITSVYITTMRVTWPSVTSNTGYSLEASTDTNFTGAIISSVTSIGTLTGLTFNANSLAGNTTYYVRVGSLWNGTTNYSSTLSTSTLTSLLTGSQFAGVSSFTVSANWVAFSSGPGNGTSEGYRVQASTAADFSLINGSSETTNAALSTLTINGLLADTVYYLRAGALNWTSTPNYGVIAGSTRTLPGPAPAAPINITGVYITTMSVTWGSVNSYTGYSLEASTANNFTGTLITSVTTNGTLGGLTFNANSLAGNTTYYVRVGSLWHGTTNYSSTLSTSTLTSLLTGSQFAGVSSFTVSANWVAFS